jgi:hypothetical protein
MKKYVTLLLFLFVSCNNPKNDLQWEDINDKSDSVLMKSNKDILDADTIQRKSDSSTKVKVFKVVTQIKYLTKEVEKFKTERINLMNELKLSKENVIVRIDTVFIETKKNFWGKEKTSINVTSETKSTEIIDSFLSEKKVIDTLNHQQ